MSVGSLLQRVRVKSTGCLFTPKSAALLEDQLYGDGCWAVSTRFNLEGAGKCTSAAGKGFKRVRCIEFPMTVINKCGR